MFFFGYHIRFGDKGTKGKKYVERMEGLFPLR